MTVKSKEVFPGGNTSLGFFSYYDYIIPSNARRIMVLKGGPGVGKSTFMKRIASQMEQQGLEVELHHCSSDNNSLDGVVFPQIQVAMIDGTSPHIVDPKNPGVVDEIIHLGDYWDEDGIRKHKEEILAINQRVGKTFQRAYRHLKAAKAIHEDLESLVTGSLDRGRINIKASELVLNIFDQYPVTPKVGFLRKLFASAITPDGFCNHLDSIFGSVSRMIVITGEAGTGKSTLIQKLANAAVERGLDCEGFYCAFDPLKIEHLLIPALDIGVTTGIEPHCLRVDQSETIELDRLLNQELFRMVQPSVEKDKQFIRQLFEAAIGYLHEAKALHDEMEKFYIPYMNFNAVSELVDHTYERILKYAGEID